MNLSRCDAVGGGPVDVVGVGLGVVRVLELGVLGALVAVGNLLQLIGERADFAAGGLERRGHGGALAIEQIDLRLNLAVRRAARRPSRHRTAAFSF